MFMLAELQDTLKVPPQSLSLALQDAITQELASLYFDKVLKDLGLCVTLYDISKVEGGSVFPGDGAPHFTVDFRLVMFRPFVGEVLIAKLKSDEEEKLWIWNYNGADMFMDLEEDVRFRVVQVKYPPIPIEQEKDARPFAPMAITGDINADGLGLVAWWS